MLRMRAGDANRRIKLLAAQAHCVIIDSILYFDEKS